MDILHIRSGKNQNDISTYSLIFYDEQANGQASEQAHEQAYEQAKEQANEHIKTKLDILFNYIIYTTREKKIDGINLADREAIINILKRLDIFVMNTEILCYFSEEQKLDYKLQYWTIKELYFSPYKIFLNNLTREQFIFRFYKTKKYMNIEKCEIHQFIAYFIRCIQEELEKGNDINDRKNC